MKPDVCISKTVSTAIEKVIFLLLIEKSQLYINNNEVKARFSSHVLSPVV